MSFEDILRKTLSAAAQIPMMRELKDSFPCVTVSPNTLAAAQIPMMRELKADYPPPLTYPVRGCSPNPYDEGTESCHRLPLTDPARGAAAQIPMMRELKVSGTAGGSSLFSRCSPNPYDEGNAVFIMIELVSFHPSCSPNPYDEGNAVQASKRER